MARTTLAGAAIALLASASAAAEPLSDWLGTWSNPSSRGLVGVEITIEGDELTITGRGSCSPTACEWGSTSGWAHAPSPGVDPVDDATAILAQWDNGFSVVTLILNRNADGTLAAQTLTYFTDGSGRTDYASTTTLSRASAFTSPGADEDCIGFSPDAVRAEEIDGRWKVTAGSMWMLDAGPERDEMRQAAYFIRHYGFAHQCFVGRPDASLEYWLTPSGAPSGPANNEDCVSIDPNNMSVSGGGSSWTVLDGPSHAAFSAPNQAEAQKIVDIVERYGFTRSCFVGRPGPSMRYLRR